MFKKGYINVEKGTRSHRLVTTGKAKTMNNHSYVEVKCDCGNIKYVKFTHFGQEKLTKQWNMLSVALKELLTLCVNTKERI